jgi:hypothetical protein
LVQLKNLGGEPSTEDEHVIDCADAFIALYNVAMSRLWATAATKGRAQEAG